jgi:hypothetical protein
VDKPLGHANGAGPQAEKPAQYCAGPQFPFIISENLYKLQKCIENIILLGKMRQIPVYSLREALHIEINFAPCCSIKHCTKFHKVKH